MSKYKRYERYKDSGVEWIGEIPEHWEVSRLKWLLKSLESGKREIDESNDFNNEVLSIGGEHIGWQGELKLNNCRYISFEFYSRLRQGKIKENDILLVKDGATIGKCAFISKNIPYPATVNEHIFILRTLQNINPKFVFYLIQSNVGQKQIILQIRGAAQPGLSSDFKSNLIFTLPPLNEQIAITNFLDQKTAEIDDLIADKEKLIELLQEKRQAVITEAVTKGLNPNVRMKDSGIEWIGEIPEHWDIRRIKYLANVRNIKASDSDNDKTYVGLENIEPKTGKLLINNNDIQQIIGETANIFKKGDVLFGKLRPYLAKCIVANFNGRCTSELLVLRTTSNILPEYLYFFMLLPIFIDVVNSSTYGAKMPRASWDFIGNLKIPLPNIKEQEEIVEYLIKLTNKIDDLISDISTQIQKLKEYRQSLISEAVTGKIDVREFEAKAEVI